MPTSFFFYDLETSGLEPRTDRVMQFAGQRTDLNMNPIGKPVNLLIKITPEVLPSPEAVLITGITPQMTLQDGMTEAEFLKYFYAEVFRSDTIFLGYNSVSFDDEFMRFMHYRNFYDAYAWQWRDNCSRWDMLNLVRMSRALRPDGIVWPKDDSNRPSNKLELLTEANNLAHDNAHDALNDVFATIALAKLIHEKQTGLFNYLLNIRGKSNVESLVTKAQPFVYTSSGFPTETFHTSVVVLLAPHKYKGSVLVYDLRYDPTPYLAMSVPEILNYLKRNDSSEARLPVKSLRYNSCPAIAPLGVINDDLTQDRLNLSLATVKKHWNILQPRKQKFEGKLQKAYQMLESQSDNQTPVIDDNLAVDSQLYDGLIADSDKPLMALVQSTPIESLVSLNLDFHDERLNKLLPLYIARNFPFSLDSDQRANWDKIVQKHLLDGGKNSRLAIYLANLQVLATANASDEKLFLLEELRLYAESLVPDVVS